MQTKTPSSRPLGGRWSRWFLGAALLATVAGGIALLSLQRPAKASTIGYALVYKAVTRALDGTKVPFVATGSATLNTVTGDVTYSADVPALGASISGTGTLAVGTKASYGIGSFDGSTIAGPYSGTAIFTGKFNADLSKFKGTIVVAIPNQFGPTPGGFTYTNGKITLVQTPL